MFCRECGAKLPDDAKFCDRCGTAQRAAVERPGGWDPAEPVRWETCTIRYLPRGVLDVGESLRGLRVSPARVVARIEAPDGSYVAHQVEVRYHPMNRSRTEGLAAEVRRRLVSALLAQGWEPSRASEDGVTSTFRRPFVAGRGTTFDV